MVNPRSLQAAQRRCSRSMTFPRSFGLDGPRCTVFKMGTAALSIRRVGSSLYKRDNGHDHVGINPDEVRDAHQTDEGLVVIQFSRAGIP